MFRGPLHHHDGIIDHDSDGQHDGKKCEGINGKSHERHPGKGSYDGHRNGRCRHERGPPILQKNHDDQQHEQACLEERLVNLLHGFSDELGIVERHGVFESGWKCFREVLEFCPHLLCRIERVAAGKLIDGDTACRAAVELGELAIGNRSQFDVGHIAQACDLPAVLGIRFHDDVLELCDLIEFAIGIDGELKCLRVAGRRGSELSSCDLCILLLEGRYDVAWHEAALLELIWVEPDSHAVFTHAEDRHATDAGDAREFILQIKSGEVIQIKRIEFITR